MRFWPFPKARSREHCWHATGVSVSFLGNGYEEALCCRCGVHRTRHFFTISERIPGHGPHVQEDRRAYRGDGTDESLCQSGDGTDAQHRKRRKHFERFVSDIRATLTRIAQRETS